MNNPTLTEFCFGMIGRADIEGSKSNVAMTAWLPQASYPCGTFVNPYRFARRTDYIISRGASATPTHRRLVDEPIPVAVVGFRGRLRITQSQLVVTVPGGVTPGADAPPFERGRGRVGSVDFPAI